MQTSKTVVVAVACLVIGACLGAFVTGFLHVPPGEKPSGESGEVVQGAPNFEATAFLDFAYVNGARFFCHIC
jgi:hypothetical protein